MNRMRLRIAERLKQSQNAAASLTTFNEIDMSNLMEFRSLYKDSVLKEEGVKLGFMSAFSRASALALKEIPAANASIEGENGAFWRVKMTAVLSLTTRSTGRRRHHCLPRLCRSLRRRLNPQGSRHPCRPQRRDNGSHRD